MFSYNLINNLICQFKIQPSFGIPACVVLPKYNFSFTEYPETAEGQNLTLLVERQVSAGANAHPLVSIR